MKERPILFSAPMVRAILTGKKTQTRRIVNPQPHPGRYGDGRLIGTQPGMISDQYHVLAAGKRGSIPLTESCAYRWREACPYGVVGDRLWVRETWCKLDDDHRIDLTKPRGAMIDFGSKIPPQRNGAAYAADVTPGGDSDRIRIEYGYKWTPSIHMPRWASRISLEVESVRVERLHAITEDDARAEGVASTHTGDYILNGEHVTGAPLRHSFFVLWDKINGKRAPWSSNPWLWVVSFRKVTP